MNINKDTWHFEAFKRSWSLLHPDYPEYIDRPEFSTNLCKYFWTVVFSPVTWFLWSFFPRFFWANWKQRTVTTLIVLSLPLCSPVINRMKYLEALGILFMIVIGFGGFIFGMTWWHQITHRENKLVQGIQLTKAYMKAKKEKACPIIKFQ